MKIALAQVEVVPGNPQLNVNNMLSLIGKAKKEKVDLIAFPEMCIGGYLAGDNWTSESFCKNLMSFNKILQEASKGIAIAYGNVFFDDEINNRVKDKSIHPNRDGRIRKYNAVYVFQNGKPAKRVKQTNILPEGVQPKTLHPTYRIFDDDRYFFSNIHIAQDFNIPLENLMQPFLIEINGKETPIGFEICEDLWCEDYRKSLKVLNPTKMLIENGAKIILNISASPWTYGKNNARDRRVLFLKKDVGSSFVPFLYVNCTGVQNNGKNFVTFDGGSTIYNKEGLPIIFSKKPYEQELMIVEQKDLENSAKERKETSKISQKYEAIMQCLKRFKNILRSDKNPRFLIGLSGGIDSSLVAALLVEAFGKENVLGINMPSIYNSEKTKNAAANLAKALNIGYDIIPIEDIVKATNSTIDKSKFNQNKDRDMSLHLENIQARVRGSAILAGLSSKLGLLFTNNGNKVETALGYATLYGDIGGAIAPIADLTKIEVVEMAKFYNKEIAKREVIPKELLPDKLWKFTDKQIQPSAELKDKQIDPMKFVYHCALIDMMTDYRKISAEKIMEWYLEGTLNKEIEAHLDGIIDIKDNFGLAIMNRWKVDDPKEFIKDLEWLDKNIQNSIFKRIQSPPIIITSKSAYGYDIRESILPFIKTEKRIELENKVLRMKKYIPKESIK